MPRSEMLPFIQCHQTRGRAVLGGLEKPARSESAEDAAGAGEAAGCALAARARAQATAGAAISLRSKAFMDAIVNGGGPARRVPDL